MKAGRLCSRIIIVLAALAVTGALLMKISDWFSSPTFSAHARAKHLIVISVDALNSGDLAQLKTLPNISRLMEQGAYAREVRGVYPSLTYPSHTSIITGVYPNKHGVIDNELFQPGVKEPEWYWHKKYIQVPTIYDLAIASGLRVGALLWPVTGKAEIHYNMPEIKAREGENQVLVALSNGSPLFLLDAELRYGKIRQGVSQPYLDDFVCASSKHLIINKKPNLLLIHLTDLDEHRHYYGVWSPEAKKALERQDQRIGDIIEASRQAGTYSDTAFVVLGDHGFLDVQYNININVELKRAGLIKTGEDGKLLAWQAMAHSCGGSAYIFFHESADSSTHQKVQEILSSLRKDGDRVLEAIYTRQDMAQLRAVTAAEFMVEARTGYSFTNSWLGEIITPVTPGSPGQGEAHYLANHGYSPDKPGYQTMFIMGGRGVRKGIVIEKAHLVDEGPTLAALLGLEMKDTDGRVLLEMLE